MSCTGKLTFTITNQVIKKIGDERIKSISVKDRRKCSGGSLFNKAQEKIRQAGWSAQDAMSKAGQRLKRKKSV